MNEKLNNGEQLSKDYTTPATDIVGFDDLSNGNLESSPNLGKFKNVDELLNTYNETNNR